MVLIKPKIEDALLLNKDKKAKKLDFDHTRFKRYSYHFQESDYYKKDLRTVFTKPTYNRLKDFSENPVVRKLWYEFKKSKRFQEYLDEENDEEVKKRILFILP